MSVSSQPLESVYWNPPISEIAELLQSLGISPPQSIDDNSLKKSPVSWRNSSEFVDNGETEAHDYVSDSEITISEIFDREATIEELQLARENNKSITERNNYFHEYLVEHFKRKQMMHVYTDESEDDALLNEYLRKLDVLERSSDNLEKSRDNWNDELARTQANIREKSNEARDSIEKMIADERSVGASTWHCGKPLVIKRVQALISRQIDRIRDIGKFRIRYTRLRDELIARQLELRKNEITCPNLTKQDYERLEAEQFHYKSELTRMENSCVVLNEKRQQLAHCVDSTRRRIIKITRRYENCQCDIVILRNKTRKCLEEKKICVEKLTNAKHFIREFKEIIEQTERREFVTRMTRMRDEHDEWMKKISHFLQDIKNLEQSLNAARANLILHGKNFEHNANKMSLINTPRNVKKIHRDESR